MGVLSESKDTRAIRRKGISIASPEEPGIMTSESSVREAVRSGFKIASVVGISAAVPTLVACRTIPWAKANLNYTAQALIISAGNRGEGNPFCHVFIPTAAIAGFFITADKTILENAKKNSRAKFDRTA